MCTCNFIFGVILCVCMTFEWQESDSKAAVEVRLPPFSHSRLICSMLLHPVLCLCVSIHMCTRAHGTLGRTVLTCAHTICVFSTWYISASAFWWVADVSLSFYVGSGAPRLETRALGSARLGLNSEPLGVTVALCLLLFWKGLLRWKLDFKKVVFLPSGGCWFVWDVFCILRPTPPSLASLKAAVLLAVSTMVSWAFWFCFENCVLCLNITWSTPEEDFMSRKVPRLKETKRQLTEFWKPT